MLTFPSDPHHVWPPSQTTGLSSASTEKKNRLPFSRLESQLTLFLKSSKSSALPGMTSFTSPVHFLSGFFSVTCLIVTSPRKRVNTCAQCVHLTNPCTKRKVLSRTKPKGKIYKTKSLRNYITAWRYQIFWLIWRMDSLGELSAL